MSQVQLLARVVKTLEDAGIPYMLTGSHASSAFGQARATHDIDFVINIQAKQVAALAAAFPPDEFGFDEVAAREAIARHDMFQLKQFASGDKIDFWVLQVHPFDQSSFNRRRLGVHEGISLYLPSVEDHILQKLKWAHDYESERQYKDALLVYEIHAAKLDMDYMRHWISALNASSTWEQLVKEAEPL